MKTFLAWFFAAAVLMVTFLTSMAPLHAASAHVDAGKKRAAVCFSCHGAEGVARVPGTPHLAGQERAYLERALRAYRAGDGRKDPTMAAMAKPLSDDDIANIAAYFAAQRRAPRE